MLSVQMEQRVQLKFLIKLRKTFAEPYAVLKDVYGNECLNDLKRDVKRSKTIGAPDSPQCQKRAKTLRKLDRAREQSDRLSSTTTLTVNVKDDDDLPPSFIYKGCMLLDGSCINPEYTASVWLLNNRTNAATSALREGRETTEDDPRPELPSPSKTEENIEKIGKLILEDRRLSIRGLDEITGIDKECVRQIWHESFNMCEVCANMVPKLLAPEQKESRMNICADIFNNTDTNPGLLDTGLLCDDKIRKCGSG
ncbi:hypothetical protein NQ318_000374 [Aromia moschata]|uniref:Uncharacterized protein n=1 Tax=Aromia moschata TaxID=1265417 RepID=A0AAV8YW21_9CUCU|nr:hypothetical protein NQ318_000374 [Aromia moschata]